MVKFMKKVPAGLFLVPMILSAILYTIAPNLITNMGGITSEFLSGTATSFIIGMITFMSGVNIDLPDLVKLLKRHGVIMLVKLIIGVAVSLLFVNLFGQDGILGISALAFVVAMNSINPSLYLSLVGDYGEDVDTAAFGFTALFSIPAIPVFVYSFSGSGGMDWMPVISTIIPFALGIILGNLDNDFRDVFKNGMTVSLPLLGWNIGQGLNLLEALQSGLPGIILALIFYVFMSALFLVDRFVLRKDGVVGAAMTSVSGTSASFPAILAASNAALLPYVTGATAQVITVSIITVIITPLFVGKIAGNKDKQSSGNSDQRKKGKSQKESDEISRRDAE